MLSSSARIKNAIDVIDSLVGEHVGKTVAGVQISVAKDGEPVLSKGYGEADVESKKPVDTETYFNYASISKLFIWIAAMQLVEDNKLNLEEDIRNYLPDGFLHLRYEEPVTFLNLMNHNAGFESFWIFHSSDETAEELEKAKIQGVDEELSLLGKSVYSCYSGIQVFKPGEYEGYSNYSSNLAAYIIERLSGEFFWKYVKEKIFDKCKMKTYYPEIQQMVKCSDPNKRAVPYDCGSKGYSKTHFYRAEGVYPSGSVVGRASDLTLFANALMPADGLESPLFKSGTTLKEFFQTSYQPTGEELFSIHHGMWGSDGNFRGVGHDGSVDGMSSFFVMLPEERLSVAVLANTSDASSLTEAVIKLFTGEYCDRIERVGSSQFTTDGLAGTYFKNRTQFVNRTDRNGMPKIVVEAKSPVTISVTFSSSDAEEESSDVCLYNQIQPSVFEGASEGIHKKEKLFFLVDATGVVKKVVSFHNEWIPSDKVDEILKL